MNQLIGWLLSLINVDPEIVRQVDQAQLIWGRPMLLYIGLALLFPIGWLIHHRHMRNLPHLSNPMRRLLTACRVTVLLILVLILGAPKIHLEKTSTQKPVVALLVDESDSMQLPAGPFDEPQLMPLAVATGMVQPEKAPSTQPAKPAPGAAPTTLTPEVRKRLATIGRLALVDAAMKSQEHAALAKLAEKFDVQTYRFARQPRATSLVEPDPIAPANAPLATSQPASQPSTRPRDLLTPRALIESPTGETDVARAIERAIDDAAGKNLAAVVLFSDGRYTTGSDPLQVIRRLAGTAAVVAATQPTSQPSNAAAPTGTAIIAFPVGSARPMVDASVIDLLAPARAAKSDIVSIVATVDSQGLDNTAVVVKLVDAAGVKLDEKPLTLRTGQRQQVTLAFKAEKPGANPLTVLVDPIATEQVRDNNSMSTTVDVETEKQRLLYIEGYPKWDFRFLDHTLRRDTGIDTTLVIEQSLAAQENKAKTPLPELAKLPTDAKGFAQYSVVMLGDISPAMLPPALQEALAKAVEEEGVGLIVQAGPIGMPHAFMDGPLGKILPVKIQTNANAPGFMTGLEAPSFSAFTMKVTAQGASHPAFRVYDTATQNRALWSQMPSFYWASAVTESVPGASVLATLESPGSSKPLVAERFAGKGRVLFIGTDSTYRWRKNIGNYLFARFWGQAIRHLQKDLEKSGEKSWLEANPKRAEPGENVVIELFAIDDAGKPVMSSEVTVLATSPNEKSPVRIPLAAVASGPTQSSPGHFRGMWQAPKYGQYTLSYTDGKAKTVTAALQVAGSGREMRWPDPDRDTLGALAQATNGALLEMHQITQLPEMIQGKPITLHATYENEVWDNWITLLILVIVYSTDLAIRRLSGLM